ncbi:L,D-transpeptidase scaffold domain-containing protein [Mucilaginibacter auburnensis]|uniref:L,D-transpeptidase-like protein n=1 Tax=Mucilaginibacter auburnensis TaxID=1457233 RepID=A0A2H9VLU3_9SPHI|nr:L,D-transpeptidase family protein [Mucilaginibacter auburnensis]PJJ79309.1 L,D-transpeptidase-like protein [Mucilaginibacter auburnensis]
MGKELYSASKNKVFKDVTPEGFSEVFQKVLAEKKAKIKQPQVILPFYENNGYDAVFVMDHIVKEKFNPANEYLAKAKAHGLNPKIFQADEINALINKIHDKKAIKTLDEAYRDLAELELLTANALVNYSNALQFGVISPRRIYQRYYTETQRPDSTSMLKVFQTANLKNYLDSIQPKNPQYVALQKALAGGVQAPGMPAEESERILAVNLERLRWKNKPTADKYVLVNIPDFTLDVMENGKSALNMKVCVGEGRNVDRSDNLVEYDESDKVDRPFSRETPQLNSMIHSVQVNPVWNIPESIATKEIMKIAARDPYYLENEGIDVYQNGKKVDDPETIDWASASGDQYSFKQRPGDGNALGKIKFLFNNKSSVYLHDTPAKLAFNKPVRAVSHGCVRVERPQELALALFGEGDKYQTIVNDMNSNKSEPTDIALPKKVPVYLTYVTCWQDANGTLQFRRDVYGLDIVLYAHMNKMIAA